jgi:hypothetical protein
MATEKLKTAMVKWMQEVGVQSAPDKFEDLFSGVAFLQMLQLIDDSIWNLPTDST